MHERHRALAALVTQVVVERRQLEADQHSLVVDRPRGARGHIEPLVYRIQLGDATDHVELALEGVLHRALGVIRRQRRAGADEQLADHRAAARGHPAGLLGVDRHVAPAEQLLALAGDDPLELGFERAAALLVGRQEAHQHPVAAQGRQLEVRHRPEQLVGHLHQDPRAVTGRRVGP